MVLASDGLLVIGIDSASWDLIKKWIEYLPNFKKLVADGLGGYIRSTYPPLTPPAWSSMLTGFNPGNTGIFDWIKKPSNLNRTHFVYSYDIPKLKLWDYLSYATKKVCIINVPLTYPAEKVNGYMVAGIPGDVNDKRFTYPTNLVKELNEVVNGYEVIPSSEIYLCLLQDQSKDCIDDYIDATKRVIKKRIETSLYLLNKDVWDFFMVTFFLIDSIQHFFWKYMDKNHPLYNPNFRRYQYVIRDFYIMIDSGISRIIKETETKPNVIIVSDHGMGPLYGVFHINNFLLKYGFLKLKKNIKENIKRCIEYKDTVKHTSNITNGCFDEVKLQENSFTSEKNKKQTMGDFILANTNNVLKNIDSSSIAYGIGDLGQIFLNTEVVNNAKLEQKIKNKIKNLLETKIPNWNNIKTKVTVIDKQELYSGKYASKIPDIFYLINENLFLPSDEITSNLQLWGISKLSAHHRLLGLFVASGPAFNKHNNEKVAKKLVFDIIDFTPTILKYFKLPILTSFDGRVNLKIFSNEYIKKEFKNYNYVGANAINKKFLLKVRIHEKLIELKNRKSKN